MDFRSHISSTAELADLNVDALIALIPGTKLDRRLAPCLKSLIDDAVSRRDFVLGALGSLYVHRPAGMKAARLVLAGAVDASPKACRAALSQAMAALKGEGVKQLAVACVGDKPLDADQAEVVATAISDATYQYRHTKPSAKTPSAVARVLVVCDKERLKLVKAGLARGVAIAAGITLAREWANRPGNHCTPTLLAQQARVLGREHGLKVQVLDRAAVEKLGMGAFLAVAQGSHEPLKFIVLRYDGAPRSKQPVVLVGKGITFDTGGVSLKPAAEMDEMKFDMGGAASVLGTMRSIAMLGPKLNVVGLIPACENMPGGRAVKPGDVVRSLSGQTIEILNTDAEGRLILCDALSYAERFKPAAVVDIATLTGACMIALGKHRSGLFSSDDKLAAALLAAGDRAIDPCWRMPLDDEYDEALKSNFADMANVGPRAGGAITAAMFLRRFTGKYPWAHLDIAGTAWQSGASKGATGRPVALLTHWILARDGA